MKRLLNKRSQSTLEYVIIWTAIVAGILFAANHFLRPRINEMIESLSDKIVEDVDELR